MVNVRDLREVSRRMTKANDDHMKAMHRVMKYCVDTPSRGWVLRPNRKWDGKDTTFEFIISGKSLRQHMQKYKGKCYMISDKTRRCSGCSEEGNTKDCCIVSH
mmetsp:Transcript_26468/g.32636  ORF Transcript_26468/g.32636 Transcript_26468/m.32636 type:complete len:103 (+) Transcript_26468:295-603(+)